MRENPVSHAHTLVIDGNLQIHHMAFDVYYYGSAEGHEYPDL